MLETKHAHALTLYFVSNDCRVKEAVEVCRFTCCEQMKSHDAYVICLALTTEKPDVCL